MKKQLKSLLLVAIFACTTLPAWSQASTEGKDFWVANTIICQPPTASKPAFPTIAVSAQKACTVTITDYAGNQLATANVTAGSWTSFGDKTATVDPADYALDPSKWYPTTDNIHATDAHKHADKINNYGLHVTATENISVYVIMRTPQYSMDASNALPVTALQSEYYLQDFYPDANGVNEPVTMTTILAIDNNTKVDITPKGNTYGKTNSGSPFTITLNKGQTYYLMSAVNSQLAGSHIVAQDGKKIAVYVGSPVTRLPAGVAARDGLFEQMMPVDYWGTQFIATRSLQKDGNVIGITATQNNTELKIDGFTQTYLKEGESYYILLQGPADPYTNKLSSITYTFDQIIMADVAYIETSCPCAVISYDTGNSFAGATNSEIVNGQGDPSSVWVSPIQQKINRITFGACYTQRTQAHFLNVVTETATCANTKLTAYQNQVGADWSNKLSWTVVPGNPTYSYARVQIGNNTPTINVFTLENAKGFIANVYGNGDDESYAYSAGSAAVEQGVNVNGETFTNGYRSDTRFCMGDTLLFDAKVGTDEIARVDWNFGDGITDYNSTAQVKHCYTVPGWYDVEADLYGHQVCTDEADQIIGTVKFSFRVVRQDTVWVDPSKNCLEQEKWADTIRIKGQNYLDSLVNFGRMDILNPDAPCTEPIQISLTTYGLETSRYSTVDEFDSAYVHGKWYFPQTLPPDGIVSWYTDYANEYGCRLYDTCYVHIKTCLDMDIPNSGAHACQGDTVILPFIYKKGDIAEAHFIYNKDKVKIEPKKQSLDWYFELPTDKLKPDYYQATITVQDTICNRTLEFPIEFSIYYPNTIFKCKFNNVLAVYNKENNGGYEFTGYQWLLDGAPIPGATQSVYHMDTTFVIGQYYSVILTRSDGVILPSCAQMIEKVNNYVSESNKAPATKHLINQRLVIRKDEKDYNVYGQRMK